MGQYSDKKVGVILAGCGVYDGAEIHEAVLTLLHLDRAGAQIYCFAPDMPQHHVVNHTNGQEIAGEVRNVLTESARIARGKIENLSNIDIRSLDAVIFPGGFGAAKNLCTYAFQGNNFSVNSDIEKLITDMHTAKKPIGFICITPVIAAKVLGKYNPSLTIGSDEATANTIESSGGKHVNHDVNEIEVDMDNRIISTPAYMVDTNIVKVSTGIEKLVGKVLELA
jgi:enhancing lycopene biosynthesis protein 2